MKIGIYTLKFHTNYGGILQAYALQCVLRKNGHDVVFLQKKKTGNIRSFLMDVCQPLYIQIGYLLPFLWEAQKAYRERAFLTFIKNNFSFINIEDVKNGNIPNLDCIVVGSDQVWRPWNKSKETDFSFFLDFAKDLTGIRRVGYSISFGQDKWGYKLNDTEKIKKLVEKFDMLSVREEDGVRICKDYLGVNAVQLIDPTLLLKKEDYVAVIKDCSIEKHAFVSYILDEDKEKNNVIISLEKIYGNVFKANAHTMPLPSIEKWISSFLGAERIITDSFHGTIFSINFNIPFVVLQNGKRGNSRLLSVLKKFNLSERLVETPIQAIDVFRTEINWNYVNSILQQERTSAMYFLSKI